MNEASFIPIHAIKSPYFLPKLEVKRPSLHYLDDSPPRLLSIQFLLADGFSSAMIEPGLREAALSQNADAQSVLEEVMSGTSLKSNLVVTAAPKRHRIRRSGVALEPQVQAPQTSAQSESVPSVGLGVTAPPQTKLD